MKDTVILLQLEQNENIIETLTLNMSVAFYNLCCFIPLLDRRLRETRAPDREPGGLWGGSCDKRRLCPDETGYGIYHGSPREEEDAGWVS